MDSGEKWGKCGGFVRPQRSTSMWVKRWTKTPNPSLNRKHRKKVSSHDMLDWSSNFGSRISRWIFYEKCVFRNRDLWWTSETYHWLLILYIANLKLQNSNNNWWKGLSVWINENYPMQTISNIFPEMGATVWERHNF